MAMPTSDFHGIFDVRNNPHMEKYGDLWDFLTFWIAENHQQTRKWVKIGNFEVSPPFYAAKNSTSMFLTLCQAEPMGPGGKRVGGSTHWVPLNKPENWSDQAYPPCISMIYIDLWSSKTSGSGVLWLLWSYALLCYEQGTDDSSFQDLQGTEALSVVRVVVVVVVVVSLVAVLVVASATKAVGMMGSAASGVSGAVVSDQKESFQRLM